jgi:hypothetical protein
MLGKREQLKLCALIVIELPAKHSHRKRRCVDGAAKQRPYKWNGAQMIFVRMRQQYCFQPLALIDDE